ncbi:hypothetical protein [Streptomyces tirandamycinicus]|uniref:Uncharacterized protein n=1 Tax=Streptomyces tirandamycinicus TaxID=2174846 RepID=A0A2S1T1V6_9ACTN|nr:hypothetical protein [Streptomyces tirandamycinicus]AWI32654.1 hypothetical protein DDW44_30515 [Streptomyces tirandamycinicus]
MRPSLPSVIVGNPAALAAHLAAHHMPGQRSKTAIARLRLERRRLNAPLPTTRPLPERAHDRLWTSAIREIRRRGGETEIESNYGTADLEITDRKNRMVLMHAEGWRRYGKQPARRAQLSYLWGPDDAGSGPWAVRVPGTVTTVADALEWLTPADVKKALEKGLRVRRQGDVYAVETTPAHDGRGVELLPESHEWRPATRYLVHRPEDGRRHLPVRLPWPVRFVQQSAYGMGRTSARAAAD